MKTRNGPLHEGLRRCSAGTVQGDVRIDVPVLLPGYAVFGKFKGDPADNFAIVATIYSIPSQLFRVPMRTINRFLKPKQRVYDRA